MNTDKTCIKQLELRKRYYILHACRYFALKQCSNKSVYAKHDLLGCTLMLLGLVRVQSVMTKNSITKIIPTTTYRPQPSLQWPILRDKLLERRGQNGKLLLDQSFAESVIQQLTSKIIFRKRNLLFFKNRARRIAVENFSNCFLMKCLSLCN